MAVSRRSPCAALVDRISAEVEAMRAAGVIDRLFKSNWDKWATSENTGMAPPPLPSILDEATHPLPKEKPRPD